jgi:hypothetical protein
MANFLDRIFNRDKLPRNVRRVFEPRKEFAEKTKNLFLLRFGKRFSSAPYFVPHPRLVLKIAAAAFAAFVVTGGISVYADMTDVKADNPMYPLKRYSETVRMTLAASSEKPQLHIEFAGRRLAEIEDLKNKAKAGVTSSTESENAQIDSEKEDMKKDMKNSLAEASGKSFPDEKLSKFCRSFRDFVGGDSSDVEEIMIKHSDITADYQNKCGIILTASSTDSGASSTTVGDGKNDVPNATGDNGPSHKNRENGGNINHNNKGSEINNRRK